jgi:transmembrane sensor
MDDDNPTSPRRDWRTDSEWFSLLERVTAGELAEVRARRAKRGWQWAAAAAGIVIVLGASLAGVAHWRNSRPQIRVAVTAPGERLMIRLPDSSTVTLGPASMLRYDRLARQREMSLDGVADFRVRHDPDRPFVVHASQADITDIGTEFVIHAYAADSTVHVAVSAGVVSVVNRDGDRGELTLRAGEVAVVHGPTAPLQVHEANPAAYGAWMSGALVFEDDSLSDVVRELGRWFDADIRIADPLLAGRRVTAVYNKPSLSSVLEALGATLGVRYEKSGRTVTLRAR